MSETLVTEARHEALIRRSRFIALAAAVDSESAAQDCIERWRDPACNHNCWAWRIGDRYRFDDDGEPGGTAGRPILQAIDSQNLDQVAVLVRRHFGGIKLGTGGLVRAYGGTAAECLRMAPRRPLIRCRELVCELPFGTEASAHQLIEQFGALKLAIDYRSNGYTLSLAVPEQGFDALVEALGNASRGALRIRSV